LLNWKEVLPTEKKEYKPYNWQKRDRIDDGSRSLGLKFMEAFKGTPKEKTPGELFFEMLANSGKETCSHCKAPGRAPLPCIFL
jgi:hypothetical protein